MTQKMNIGIVRETKVPADRRVAVTPRLGVELTNLFPQASLFIQPSDIRAFSDLTYLKMGLTMKQDLSECDLLIGVKEVAPKALLEGKTYLMFAHVAKQQAYNQSYFQELARKKITLIDYEYLTDDQNVRLVAFGYWAGIVGAYNGLLAAGVRFGAYQLPPPQELSGKKEMFELLKKIEVPNLKFLVTGGGRVAGGAMEVFNAAGIKQVPVEAYLNETFDEPVVCRIEPDQYVQRKDGSPFNLQHFFAHPEQYESTFAAYTRVTDVFVPCHFWDQRSPVFFTREMARRADFKIRIIADISCDLQIPIPSTLRASTHEEPFYDYNRFSEKENPAFSAEENITVMAVDNLPGALPLDASEDFGQVLFDRVIPALIKNHSNPIIERATILKKGELTPKFAYLKDYLTGTKKPECS